MRKLRKNLLILATIPMLFSCGNITYQGNELVLKVVDNYKGEYEMGYPIDTENFFYCSKHGKGVITVSYKDEFDRNVIILYPNKLSIIFISTLKSIIILITI